jgi:hypothetical protein
VFEHALVQRENGGASSIDSVTTITSNCAVAALNRPSRRQRARRRTAALGDAAQPLRCPL